MKFHEQFGYDPDEFSNASPWESGNPEEMAELRSQSVAAVNPFAEPVFTTPSPRQAPRETYSSPGTESMASESNSHSQDEPEGDIPTQNVDWIILQPGEGEERGPGLGFAGSRSSTAEDDPERIKKLKALALEWGNDSYIAVSNIRDSKGAEYQVAVLPAVIGGIVVEHALGETVSADNALYAWRAEKGMDENGEVTTTWQDVFVDKKTARDNARRIYHTPSTDERVREYFARPAENIDDPF